MPKLTIIAHITTKPSQTVRVKAELAKLVKATRAEAGCLQYDLHQDNERPEHFMFYENWQSRELWQAHMESSHLKAFHAASEGAVAETTIYEMTPVV